MNIKKTINIFITFSNFHIKDKVLKVSKKIWRIEFK